MGTDAFVRPAERKLGGFLVGSEVGVGPFQESLPFGNPYSPSPPNLWNHRLSEKSRKNPRAAITYGQNLSFKGLRGDCAADFVFAQPPDWPFDFLSQGYVSQGWAVEGCGKGAL